MLAASNSMWFGPQVECSRDLGKTWEQANAQPSLSGKPKYAEHDGPTANRIWHIEPGGVTSRMPYTPVSSRRRCSSPPTAASPDMKWKGSPGSPPDRNGGPVLAACACTALRWTGSIGTGCGSGFPPPACSVPKMVGRTGTPQIGESAPTSTPATHYQNGASVPTSCYPKRTPTFTYCEKGWQRTPLTRWGFTLVPLTANLLQPGRRRTLGVDGREPASHQYRGGCGGGIGKSNEV